MKVLTCFLCVALVHSKASIFLLGDSVSVLLYKDGLIPLFNCTIPNTHIKNPIETLNHFRYNQNKPMLCLSDIVDQIGYLFHWGVGIRPEEYNPAWDGFRTRYQTVNSRHNIILGLKEFQKRSAKNLDAVIFIFNSNLWDATRYLPTQSTKNFYDEYAMDYSTIVVEILRELRPQDILVLQTMHFPRKEWLYRQHSLELNSIIRKAAMYFNLPMLDVCEHIQDDETHLKPNDPRHQTAETSLLIAKQIEIRNWTSPYKC